MSEAINPPSCTLHRRPHTINHCALWAKEIFSEILVKSMQEEISQNPVIPQNFAEEFTKKIFHKVFSYTLLKKMLRFFYSYLMKIL